jgi:hypothetical protein
MDLTPSQAIWICDRSAPAAWNVTIFWLGATATSTSRYEAICTSMNEHVRKTFERRNILGACRHLRGQ